MRKFIQIIKHQATGFTLMEVVVATGIFIIMVMAIMGIFTSVLKAQRNTIAQTRLEREAQLVMETIVKSIRSSRVDYDRYTRQHAGPIALYVSFLFLINNNDEEINYYHFVPPLPLPPALPEPASLNIETFGFNSPITSNSVHVTGIRFYIQPNTDPFSTNEPPDSQPRVTIVLDLISTQTGETAQVTLQQTVPQRGGNY